MLPTAIYDVIGVMSGTSLDGLDIAWCRFHTQAGQINFQIIQAKTVQYQDDMREKLGSAQSFNGLELQLLHNEFGCFIGEQVNAFISKFTINPYCIASHGHTVFHDPAKRFTLQIGNGACIAAKTGVDTVCDFRTLDVILGGQGAPLVPFGDIHMFSKYDTAMNLGGFSNITLIRHQPVKAFDICPVNIVLNSLAQREGCEYDAGGRMAEDGTIMPELLELLEQHPHYQLESPPSLSREWIENNVLPHVRNLQIPVRDYLRTFCEHIALRISEVLNKSGAVSCLVTGGGAYNNYLLSRIQELTTTKLVVPDDLTVQFKESLIFAFLGLKRMLGEINVLSEITGADRSTSSGKIWKG